MIENLRHVGIVVDDLELSMNFYIEKLGFEVFKRMDESGSFLDHILGFDNLTVTTVKMVLKNGQMIELLDFHALKNNTAEKLINDIGLTHIALTVGDLDSIYNDFKNSGIDFIADPKVSADGSVKVAFCKAPEGTFVELVEILKG
ncbi:MAG: lactoylglutathione lyase [Candidatus Azotimanducaceae bacterium]|jgi:lactoylglutathione lyase